MEVLSKLNIEKGSGQITILFGHPNTHEEMLDMFKLRFNIYKRNGYLKEKLKEEKDQYDIKDNGVKYFIAKIDNRVIAHVRLIEDDILPTEKFFVFDHSLKIEGRKGELSRLVADTKIGENEYIPRNIIFLFLIRSLVDYGIKNNITHGYCFIKSKLKNKINKLKIPVKEIKKYETVYPKDGLLYDYFYKQKEDPVIPIFFITREIKSYIDNFTQKKWFFNKEGENEFTLKSNIYTEFLKKSGIM